jgi:hypothetical protein
VSGPPRTCLEAALEYRARGWSPLPTQDDKRPHFAALQAVSGSAKWGRLRRTLPSEREIREWYARYPNAGVGILTGSVSGGLLVCDFDAAVPSGIRLPGTPIVKTKRGIHTYHAGGHGVSCMSFAGGEIKAEGGYVVAPPTRLDGNRRTWLIAPDGLGTAFLPEETLADHRVLTRHLLHLGEPESQTEQIRRRPAIYSCVPSDKKERAVWLEAWDSDESFVADAAALIGIPAVPIGTAFLCVLPGHGEAHPSASLYHEPRRGSIRYRDWHTREWHWITEVYAAVTSGRVATLRGPGHARWKLRLLIETGRVVPASDNLPPLPPGAPNAARTVYGGLRLLLQSRGLTEPGQPTPFTREFGSRWCGGMAESTFEKGKGWLIQHRVIRKAGRYGRMGLWLPGSAT